MAVGSGWGGCRAEARVAAGIERVQSPGRIQRRDNRVSQRGSGAPARLVTASAGNHGRGLAAAAETFRVALVVFTPADAPRTKLSAIERHGATLRTEAPDYDAGERMAKAFAAENGAEFISPYSDPDVIAGAATVALEIFEDAPATDVLAGSNRRGRAR